MSKGEVCADGILFPPTPSGKEYIALFYHRGSGGRDKSVWLNEVSPEQEHDLFSTADDKGWSDHAGHYWSLRDGGRLPLGTRDERIAKHPRTTNPSDPWHGYPASPALKGNRDAPGDELIEQWLVDEVVTRAFARRIQTRRV